MKKSLFLLFTIVIPLSGCSTLDQKQVPSKHYAYGTKSVYQPQASSAHYQATPNGYHLVYTELLARHGSRALSSPKYDYISLKIWQAAKAQNALTPLGKRLGPEIERFMAANQKMGYGNLSKRGKLEQKMIGERLVMRDKSLFERAVNNHQPIEMEYSGKKRAKDSGLAFISGMEQENPAIRSLVSKPIINKAQLYFHKQKSNQYYQDYKKHDPALQAAIKQLMNLPKTHAMAQQMLERVYTPAFVAQLAAGKLSFLQKNKSKPTIYNDVDAAIQLFNLYLAAPGLSYEAGKQPWQFIDFVTPAESQWFTYVLDGKDFYEKGPSFAGTDITYRMAKVLEDDFFKEVKGIQNGSNKKAAKIRFAHAETVIPFAAQMHLEGSTKSVAKGQLYRYENNPWRGSWVSPYSANIQWDVYKDKAGTLLVRMLYNEKEIPFSSQCQPIQKGSYFYKFTELEHCYGE
ncbi:histidine-type phosphatase [Marinomonas spartinae]|uniref:histidine-type phosphatase n=1 Tax=Marinomonas spartinae TaxID=1792290 RepID=UPI0018F19C6F|nr:histidine-type phosphatase [Marinomonas spartinae]MBJ7555043.1 histidine-type phosphatase [Marinomonas spartinae]